jgi:amidase
VVFGALTRSVRDSGVMLDVLARQPRGFEEAARTRPRRLRIGLAGDFPPGVQGRLSDEVRGALATTADVLRSLGHTVSETRIPMRARDVPVILGLMFRGIYDLVQGVEQAERLERRTRALARPGALVSDRMTDRLIAAQNAMVARVGALFADYDVLLTPVMSRPAVRAGVMEGRGATVTYVWQTSWVPFTILWNISGQPAASVPVGQAGDGLPLAVQIVGRPNDERTILSLAGELETERPWTQMRPPVS